MPIGWPSFATLAAVAESAGCPCIADTSDIGIVPISLAVPVNDTSSELLLSSRDANSRDPAAPWTDCGPQTTSIPAMNAVTMTRINVR